MSGRGVVVDTSGDGVVRLRLDQPPGNVLDIELCRRLRGELQAAARDDRAKLLVLASAGEHFSFGASVEEHLPATAPVMLEEMSRLVAAVYSHPYPTLAAVRGRCLGGGLEAALACDLVIAEESAVFAAPEISLGVFAPAATVLLQASVPRCVAAEILLTGRSFGAAEAASWGVINRVVADGTLEGSVSELAEASFVGRSPASLRQAVQAYRRACHSRAPGRVEAGLACLESQYVAELLPMHDGAEGIRAFLEKREPAWEGR